MGNADKYVTCLCLLCYWFRWNADKIRTLRVFLSLIITSVNRFYNKNSTCFSYSVIDLSEPLIC